MFFALGNALMDASIGAWWTKYKDKWDFWRPITAIRHVYKEQDVISWRGPNANPSFGTVKGKDWMPYQDADPGRHPAVPRVRVRALDLHGGREHRPDQLTRAPTPSAGPSRSPANSSKFEPGVPANPVTLTWPTFTAAADEAGMSRRYGGIHFYSGDMHGRALGNLLGRGAYSRAQAYIQGTIGS